MLYSYIYFDELYKEREFYSEDCAKSIPSRAQLYYNKSYFYVRVKLLTAVFYKYYNYEFTDIFEMYY